MQVPRPTSSFDEQDLHAYADGRMAPAEAAALSARLAQAPQAHAQAGDWQRQRQQLRALRLELLGAPVPGALQALAAQVDHAAARQSQWWRWGGMAASVLLAFALGWLGRSAWPPGAQGTLASAPAPIQGFAHQAALAYAVYQPEQRHPVEVAADQQAHLVQWLSKRLERPLKLPVLSAEGYELVGGRLLPGDAGARAQFMYQDRTGQRITLYLGAVPGTAPTAFRFTDEGPVPGFYWTEQGFGYALSGPLPRAALLQLARAVHRQL
ncbi:anti-sigma factor [Acidovorax sp. SRB_14]|uniref:anti-sigma factor family protein n=1 Tax=unclassified Acidovorax TaxID=2684926 RepID=UPI00145DF91B|nr:MULTISPECIES: anti-sigma factor [unclassified Acidovorax]NMM75294.1 anti-sigma factor [Acidovorax sp. SRB_24]NMM80802.1 anti-sigma factor [Acidovorax sp. SRB_14]NMM85774.1 anti-sigma factor [Rhodococcus sp. SRB_17]